MYSARRQIVYPLDVLEDNAPVENILKHKVTQQIHIIVWNMRTCSKQEKSGKTFRFDMRKLYMLNLYFLYTQSVLGVL